MKLSIVIICWNDWKVIKDCLESIFKETKTIDYEVIVSDNGSTDGSVENIRREFPQPNLRIVENGENLGFSRGNNAGIEVATGDYILILNPDTIIHDRALEKWVSWADARPKAGAFGVRVLNVDGSYQQCAKVFPTVGRLWIDALGLRGLGAISNLFLSRTYVGWKGDTERVIDWQSGCCVMFRGELLHRLRGFDPQFFYHCEEVDLCKRVWEAGYTIEYMPSAAITHLGGQSVKRMRTRFAIETHRSLYKYFYKHYGLPGVEAVKRPLVAIQARQYFVRRIVHLFKPTDLSKETLEGIRAVLRWNWLLRPGDFAKSGQEPNLGYEPMGKPPIKNPGLVTAK